MFSTVGDFVRLTVAVAAGCALYDSIMYSIAKLRYRKYLKASTAQMADMQARYAELKAQAEAKKQA